MYKTQINRLLIAVVLFNLCVMFGCHRGYYRRQADAEARRLVLQKADDPRWNWADGEIDIDPQSRMFSPFSADHPPIPPDDAASHQLMHVVDGKEGYSQWHVNGDTNYVENPEWQAYLPVNEKGQVVLTLDRAFELALLHSPRFQQARETLYLSALDVSLQRFGFDTQMFAGFNSFMTTQGRFRNGSGTSSTTLQNQLGANGGGIDFQRLGLTGATFAAGLANTILFNFAGADTNSTTTLVDFSVIQPLLRGAGRARIMESLTQTERTLLGNVRQMERFRRGFFLEIATGRGAGGGPGVNFLATATTGSLTAGGFFGLLQQQQQIRNQELNVRQLESGLEQFKEFFAAGRLDAVGFKDFENNVYTNQRTLLRSKTSYETALDRFKSTLGLPPELDVIIEDGFLDRFELISDEINERIIVIDDLREETGVALNEIGELFKDIDYADLENGTFVWPTDLVNRLETLTPYIKEAELTLDRIINENLKEVENDLAKLESTRPSRLAYLNKVQQSIESGEIISDVDPALFEPDSIPKADELRIFLTNPAVDDLYVDGAEDLDDDLNKYSILKKSEILKSAFEAIGQNISGFEQKEQDLPIGERYKFLQDQILENIPGRLADVKNLIVELSTIQAYARSNSIEIQDIEISSEQAIRIARCMRRDWMNARSSLVDSWRNIEFVANQLEAQVDLVFQGDMGNRGNDNPLKLRYETGQLRAGFRFDSPIVRLSERNQYRRALIQYQQTRRQFYQFEDGVKANLRLIIRNVNRAKVQFELDRRTVQSSIESVEVNRFKLLQPVGVGGGGSLSGETSRNLAGSINQLNQAQDSILSSWIESEVMRRSLDFDLGTMQLDSLGRWIDPGAIDSSIGIRAASIMGIEIECQFCDDIGSPYPSLPPGTIFNVSEAVQAQENQLIPLGDQPAGTSEIQPVPVPEPLSSAPAPTIPLASSSPNRASDPIADENRADDSQVLSEPIVNSPTTGIRLSPNSPEAILARVPSLLFHEIGAPATVDSLVAKASVSETLTDQKPSDLKKSVAVSDQPPATDQPPVRDPNTNTSDGNRIPSGIPIAPLVEPKPQEGKNRGKSHE